MIRERIKRLLAPLRYPHPVPELGTDRLYLYLDVLWKARELPGAVVEVGCFQCGTSAWAFRFLNAIGHPRPYFCYDTFSGFPDDQFAHDVQLGTRTSHRGGFRANSPELVGRLLEQWKCRAIQLVQADIVAMPAGALPEAIAVALIDVDLETPTLAALAKVYSRLVPNGVILVDDCAENDDFRGARVAYQRFVADHQLPERYVFGMGVIGESIHEIE
jgi:O-methyltransferase